MRKQAAKQTHRCVQNRARKLIATTPTIMQASISNAHSPSVGTDVVDAATNPVIVILCCTYTALLMAGVPTLSALIVQMLPAMAAGNTLTKPLAGFTLHTSGVRLA